MQSKIRWILGTAALIVMLVGCGKATPPPPLAMPAPLPPVSGYPGGGGAVSCGGSVGQYPFSQTPFLGTSGSNSIQLTLGFSGFPSGASQYQNVVGSALLNLPGILQNSYSPAQTSYQFCVTSAPASGGQPFPGTYVPQDQSVAMVMYGYVQAPLVNPYDPTYYQGGSQFTQVPAMVSIGQSINRSSYNGYDDCGARLLQGRISGCVEVRLGNNGQVRRLYF